MKRNSNWANASISMSSVTVLLHHRKDRKEISLKINKFGVNITVTIYRNSSEHFSRRLENGAGLDIF